VIENSNTHEALRSAEAANEEAQDILARSYYEQARAVMLSRQPGRRWQALELIRKSKALTTRERQSDQESEATGRLPSLADLRREAVEALRLEDAREALVGPTLSFGYNTVLASGNKVVFSPDCRRLATWSSDRIEGNDPRRAGSKLRLFDLDQGGRLVTEKSLSEQPAAIALSPNGEWAALPDKAGHIRLFRLYGGNEERELPKLEGPDGPVHWDVTYWSPQSGRPLQFHNRVRNQVDAVFRSDGRLLVTTKEEGNLKRIIIKDVITGMEIGPGIKVSGLRRFSGDGSRLFVGGIGDRISVWELETGKRSGELDLAADNRGLVGSDFATSFDGQWLCVAVRDENTRRMDEMFIQMHHVPTQKLQWQLPLTAILKGIPDISPDNRLAAIGYTTGILEIRELTTGEEMLRWQMPGGKRVLANAFSRDSAYLAFHDGTAPVHLLHLGELRKALEELGLGW
jgi:WD40 repeat protein